jgi:hypothetical protein
MQIRKAYKKRALKCHPDKNPDNPNAGKKYCMLFKWKFANGCHFHVTWNFINGMLTSQYN